MADERGKARETPLGVPFDRRLKLDLQGTKITSDSGLLTRLPRAGRRPQPDRDCRPVRKGVAVTAPPALPRRSLLLAAAAFLVASREGARAAAADPAAAQRFIQELGDRTVEALNRAGYDEAARTREMRAVLDSSVDVPAVARISMGRSWRQASEAQRAEYLELFRTLTLGILARRLSSYTGSERFVVSGSRSVGSEDVMVRSQVLYADYPPLNIDWRVRRPEAAKPTIVDIVVEGVSLILTNRAEVDAMVGRRGVDGLLAELRSRIKRGEGAPGSG